MDDVHGGARAAPGGVDYHAVFDALSSAKLVLSPDLVVLDANEAFLETVGLPGSVLLGRHVLDAFPVPPTAGSGPGEDGEPPVVASLRRVARTGRPEVMGPHRYDLRDDGSGGWQERWWITTHVPVLDAGGRVTHLLERVEDVTDIVVTAGRPAPGAERHPEVVEHAMAVTSTLERFSAAFQREREAAIELQESILTPPPDAPGLTVAVRYRPAAREVRVGGDWYDAFGAPDGSTVVVVGDATGHDIRAAGHMDQLRGTLRAVAYAHDASPGPALDLTDRTALGLGLDATATVLVARVGTAADDGSRAVVWSSAGHPPPLVRRADGTTAPLPGRTGVLLGLGLGAPRPEHAATLRPGDMMLLFTDGLVERRGTSLSASLAGLADLVGALPACTADELLDAVLAALVPCGAEDDVAILALRVEDPHAPEG
ncbi:PP2C family protein-serine/threonine phosphatase [Cellulomonas sp. JZ18]|uniref:PP2C family protein-serine/threonine phosphatase n=1 Tax=Cellulomonas sp. JZ18 TaxID=2654191 RepID=UPI0018AFBDF9|nr:SpoIIE family protein phosphatase [Cellulomonas sp. JZ18]